MIETLIQDLRYAARLLLKNPGFSALAIAVLALGIGANTAVFSVINGVLLKPLPFTDPDMLVKISSVQPSKGGRGSGVSLQDYLDWKEQARSFQTIAAFNPRSANISGESGPERVDYALVSADFFAALGVNPALGRAFITEDDRPGGGNVVVLSYRFWQRYFGGDRDCLGKPLVIDGGSCTVVGVMPPHMIFPDPGIEMWKPIALAADASGPRDGRWLEAIGRLRPETTLKQAQAEIEAVAAGLEQQHPSTNRGWSARIVPLHESMVGSVRTAMNVLWGAVFFFLLIACANLASLGLERAASREKEIAIRSALGAGRGRIARQLLTESVLLSLVGGAAGLFLAAWVVDLLATMAGGQIPRLEEVKIDRAALAYTASVSLLSGIVFGSFPALRASKAMLGEALKASGRGLIGTSRYRLHRLVVSGQVALTLVLLVGAGLLVRSFANLLDADTGFDSRDLLTVRIAPPLAPPRPDQTMETYIEHFFAERQKTVSFYSDLIARLDSLPGVRATGAINRLPMRGSWWQLDLEIEGSPPPDAEDKRIAFGRVITPRYFDAMGIPLLNGRVFEEADGASTRRVAVINSAMSRRYFSGTDPLGRRIRMAGEPDEWGWATIIGVVGDVRHADLASEAEPMIYVPLSQAAFGFFGDWGMTMVIRTEINPMSMVAAVRREALSLNATLPIYEIAAMDQVIGETIAERRFNMYLLASFALLALALAAAGIYGVISYQTNNRTREIGIRMALGAERGDILKMVLKEGIAVAAAGVTAGLGGAFALTRAMTSLLYEVSATDPAVFFGLAIMLLAVAAAACYIPARRATKIDPMIALRCE